MFVAAVLLAAAPVLAAPPVLEDIRVLSGPRLVVSLQLSAPAGFRTRALQADGIAPSRLYLDLAGTVLGGGAPRVREGTGPLLRVRTGQFDPDTTRVVLDLRGEMPFEVRAEGSTVTVTLTPAPVTAQTEHERPAPEPAPKASVPSPEPPPVAKVEGKSGTPLPPAAEGEKKTRTSDQSPIAKAERIPAPAPPPPAKIEAAPEPPPSAAVHKETAAPVTPPTAKAESKPSAGEPTPPVKPRAPGTGALVGPELPAVAHAPVGPPAAATPVPPRPLTPQDVIVMNAPRPPAPGATVPTTTLPPSRAASPRGAVAVPGEVGPPAPPVSRPAAKAEFKRPRIGAAVPPTPLIVLDAGHGGRDPGAEGVGGVIEKAVVLELTRVLAKRITERLHANVFLTRSDDSYITIDQRLAVPSDATLFISLHANSCPDPSARGLEIFYGGGAVRPVDTAGASPRAALLGRYLDEALNARVGGVRGSARLGSFSILMRNPLPSALVEIGYLTHPEEAALSQDAAYQELMADALVDGLDAFLRAAAPPL